MKAKVTRIGNYVRVNMIETSRSPGVEPGTPITFFVGANVYDQSFPDGKFVTASYLTRVQMSDFVVVNDRLLKCRFFVEDVVNAYAERPHRPAADWL